jgi:effector-binding domain-containing protein
MLKKILLGLVGLIVVLVLIGFLLPREARVERSIIIDRPASVIFPVINSFERFGEWSPWQELDPNLKVTVSGQRAGVGAKYSWTGNDKVGIGTQEISASEPNKSVTNDLDFGDMGRSKAVMSLTPEGSGTRVNWTLDSDLGTNPLFRYFGLLMDRMVGKDYERGLAKLKALAESMPNTDIAGFVVEEATLQSVPLLVVSKTSATDTPAISAAYAEAYGAILQFMQKQKLQQTGAPVGIDGAMTEQSFAFEAGIPIDRADVTPPAGITLRQSYGGRALKTVHVGPYDTLAQTYAKFEAYKQAHHYKPTGGAISWYVDDPSKVAPAELKTEIYWPLD